MTERTELEKAIAVLEAQRAILGDAVVEAAIAPIREQLRAQERPAQRPGIALPAERKLITILFADVAGSTALAERLGAETTRLILDRCLRRISEAVQEFGGTINKLMGDGLMALFGVPQVHEDDPERAVLTAARIHQNVAGYVRDLGQPLEVRVGINTGRVVLGEMGGEAHTEHTAMGPPVNLAARLQSAASPGKTLLGEATARMVRYRFEVEAVEPLTLKGFEGPVTAYEPAGKLAQPAPARGIPGLQSAMVGRERELDKLVELAGKLEQGIGGIAALLGEPGIGKSRLLQETKEARKNGALRFAEGRAYSYTQDQPLSVILDLLAELLDLAADDSPAIVDLKLEAALSPLFERELESVWPFLAELLGAPPPPQYAGVLSGLDPEALSARMGRAVQLLVRRTSERHPLVLSFEDLHWADRGSLKVIESLLQDTERYPLLLILLFRPDRDKPVWQLKITAETYFAHRYLELPLRPLDVDATAQMIENLLTAADFPDNLRAMIAEKAEGNPLYVEELIRSLIDSEVLIKEGDSWRRGPATALSVPATALSVPETVEKVIQARLDRLSGTERRTLQAASVIGRRFSYRLLEGVLSADGNLRSQLLRLQQTGMIRERSRLPELEYIFKHVIIQEVTYGTLLGEQRRELHRRAATTLEKLYPERGEEVAATLAEHYNAAGEKVRAIEQFVLAAERAEEVYAFEEAVHFLRRAKALSEPDKTQPEERLKLLERLADTHYLLREALEAFNLYREALELQQSLVDGDRWTTVRLHRKIGQAWWILPHNDERRLEAQALASLKAGLRLTDGQAPHLETVRLLIMVSNYTRAARYEEWRTSVAEWQTEGEYAQRAVRMAEQLDAPVELSAALEVLGSSYIKSGRLRDGLLVAQRRQRLSRDSRFDDLREKLDILVETALALKMFGEYAQAIPLLLEAEDLGEQIQDVHGHVAALYLQAECWTRLDRWDEVLLAEERVQVLQRRHPLQRLGAVCWLLAFSASVHTMRGEKKKGARMADESYAIMTIVGVSDDEEKNWGSAQYY